MTEHKLFERARPRRTLALDTAPADLMIVDYDARDHDPRNTAQGFRPVQPGACEFVSEGRVWQGDRRPRPRRKRKIQVRNTR